MRALRSTRVYVYTSAVTFAFYLNEIPIDSAFPDKRNQLETQSQIETTPLNASMGVSLTSRFRYNETAYKTGGYYVSTVSVFVCVCKRLNLPHFHTVQ